MQTLIFHENIHINFEKIKNFNITFDDGLYSQIDLIQKIKKGTLFICPSFIRDQYIIPQKLSSINALLNYKLYNNKCGFMSLDEIKKLIDLYDITIGSHSYYHDIIYSNNGFIDYTWKNDLLKNTKFTNIKSKLTNTGYLKNGLKFTKFNLIQYIKEDTEKSLEWFYKYLKLEPTKFAFPFNDEYILTKNILKTYKFNEFFGSERLNYNNIG